MEKLEWDYDQQAPWLDCLYLPATRVWESKLALASESESESELELESDSELETPEVVKTAR